MCRFLTSAGQRNILRESFLRGALAAVRGVHECMKLVSKCEEMRGIGKMI